MITSTGINGSCDFRGPRSLRYVTTLISREIKGIVIGFIASGFVVMKRYNFLNLSCDFARPHDKRAMQFHGWKSFKVNNNHVNFRGFSLFRPRVITYLKSCVTLSVEVLQFVSDLIRLLYYSISGSLYYMQLTCQVWWSWA